MFTYESTPNDDDGHIHYFACKNERRSYREVIEWCNDQFGAKCWNGRWCCTYGGTSFWFQRDEDAFAFKMRWG